MSTLWVTEKWYQQYYLRPPCQVPFNDGQLHQLLSALLKEAGSLMSQISMVDSPWLNWITCTSSSLQWKLLTRLMGQKHNQGFHTYGPIEGCAFDSFCNEAGCLYTGMNDVIIRLLMSFKWILDIMSETVMGGKKTMTECIWLSLNTTPCISCFFMSCVVWPTVQTMSILPKIPHSLLLPWTKWTPASEGDQILIFRTTKILCGGDGFLHSLYISEANEFPINTFPVCV